MALVVPEVYAFVEVLAEGFVSVFPCSNEHIWRNWVVKTVSSETRGGYELYERRDAELSIRASKSASESFLMPDGK